MGKEPVEICVLGKRVRLLQPEDGFRTSLDSVMLAAACPVKEGKAQSVLDMGCGVGGAGFCVLERVGGCTLTGVDIDEHHIELAEKNRDLNETGSRASFICSDIRDFEVGTPEERFDHVICNPPYLEAGRYFPSPSEQKAVALGHKDEELTVRAWVAAGLRLLKSGGSLTMIHRADAVDRIILALGRSFGATEVIPLWPRNGKEAKRVIVRSLKDRQSPATLHPGIVLHNEDGGYTEEADRILRGDGCV